MIAQKIVLYHMQEHSSRTFPFERDFSEPLLLSLLVTFMSFTDWIKFVSLKVLFVDSRPSGRFKYNCLSIVE